jgi:hypothetical protein
MRRPSKGKLLALMALTALIPSRLYAQDGRISVAANAPSEQRIAYDNALRSGPAALVDFMRTFPHSRLIPDVIRALAAEVGPQDAVQAALDADVPSETILGLVAELSPSLTQANAVAVNASSVGPY